MRDGEPSKSAITSASGQRALAGVQHERRLALQLDGGEHAEGAEPDPGGGEDLRVLVGRAVSTAPSAVTDLQPAHLGGQPAERAPVPWVPVEIAPGDGLDVDVAEVGHRQPAAHSSG